MPVFGHIHAVDRARSYAFQLRGTHAAHRAVAQLVEQRSPKPQVAGSSPVRPAGPASCGWSTTGTSSRKVVIVAEKIIDEPSRGRRRERAQGARSEARPLRALRACSSARCIAELRKVVTPTRKELVQLHARRARLRRHHDGARWRPRLDLGLRRELGVRRTDRLLGVPHSCGHSRTRTKRNENHVTENHRDDIDLATAAEQSSEEDEAQEGNSLAADEDSVDSAEHEAIHIEDESATTRTSPRCSTRSMPPPTPRPTRSSTTRSTSTRSTRPSVRRSRRGRGRLEAEEAATSSPRSRPTTAGLGDDDRAAEAEDEPPRSTPTRPSARAARRCPASGTSSTPTPASRSA